MKETAKILNIYTLFQEPGWPAVEGHAKATVGASFNNK